MNEVVTRIYELIAQSGITKNELAEKIGVSKNVIQYWKKENGYPSLSIIERICEVFNITVEQFFCGMGGEQIKTKQDRFLDEWRMLTSSEKQAIEKVISAFKEAKAVSND